MKKIIATFIGLCLPLLVFGIEDNNIHTNNDMQTQKVDEATQDEVNKVRNGNQNDTGFDQQAPASDDGYVPLDTNEM